MTNRKTAGIYFLKAISRCINIQPIAFEFIVLKATKKTGTPFQASEVSDVHRPSAHTHAR